MDKEDLLKKWLGNELSEAEQKIFEESEDYKLNKKIIDTAMHFKAPPFSENNAYDQLKAKMDVNKTPIFKLKSANVFLRIAAIFLIFFSLFSVYRIMSVSKIETLASQKITVELPDGSSVSLNSMSNINYSKYRWKKNRIVSLEGEAFFVVAKGSKFDVETSTGIISVLGTQFSVKDRKKYFEVKCYEGIVSVTNNGRIQKLDKGSTYRFVNNDISVDSIKDIQPDWLSNISSFKSVPLYEVLKEIERQYNVSIILQDVDTSLLYTGSFGHDNLDQALKAVTIAFNLTFQRSDLNKILITQSE